MGQSSDKSQDSHEGRRFSDSGELPPPGTSTVHAAVNSPDFLLSETDSLQPEAILGVQLDPPIEPGDLGQLGGYRILKQLGEGGMGTIYLAIDTKLHRTVALKVMKPEIACDEIARKRFLLEGRAVAAIDHDNIIPINHVGEHKGLPFLDMKYLEGRSLDEVLKKFSTLEPISVIRLGRQISRGLAAAHSQNLIHRDIKPANIWIESYRNRVKILDFGLVRMSDSIDTQMTLPGVIVGTPAYMSPEQASGIPLDSRSDLFSLGILLYRVAVGELPFKGKNNLTVLQSITRDEPPPPHKMNPAIPRKLSRLIMKLLEKDREKRPANAQMVADTFKLLEHELSSSATENPNSETTRPNTAPPAFHPAGSGINHSPKTGLNLEAASPYLPTRTPADFSDSDSDDQQFSIAPVGPTNPPGSTINLDISDEIRSTLNRHPAWFFAGLFLAVMVTVMFLLISFRTSGNPAENGERKNTEQVQSVPYKTE
jgi:serine/threonine protein kinase